MRPAFHNNVTKRYRGGTARKIWKLTIAARRSGLPDLATTSATSHSPLWWSGRVYFVSDRDGTMNLWSMDESGRTSSSTRARAAGT